MYLLSNKHTVMYQNRNGIDSFLNSFGANGSYMWIFLPEAGISGRDK